MFVEVLASDNTCRVAGFPEPMHDIAMAKRFHDTFLTAFPDLRVTVVGLVAEGDQVVGHWTSHATHTGPLAGSMGTLPPTGRRGSVEGVIICRLVGDKIVEEWAIFDLVGLLQQLGAIPTTAGA